eukprot:UN33979
MPFEKFFYPRAFVNYEYFDRRNIYLSYLKKYLESKKIKAEVGLFQHDNMKPILILDHENIKIRIMPTLNHEEFLLRKLGPDRNCVREKEGDTTSTPFYNQQILEDLFLRKAL